MSDKARVMLFDIEATDLEASFGHTLCFGYMYLGDKHAKVISVVDYKAKPNEEPDAALMRKVHDLITNHADIIVTYYGKEYDRKFLNTRMLMSGLPPLPPLGGEHVDLYFTARGNLKLHSNRLQAVSESLECPLSKTSVRADVWRRAQQHAMALHLRGRSTDAHRTALAYVVEHCKLDVEILKWCYLKLRPFVRQHPPVTAEAGDCRACGARSWRSNGFRYRAGGKHRRLQCQACGYWAYQNPATGKMVQ